MTRHDSVLRDRDTSEPLVWYETKAGESGSVVPSRRANGDYVIILPPGAEVAMFRWSQTATWDEDTFRTMARAQKATGMRAVRTRRILPEGVRPRAFASIGETNRVVYPPVRRRSDGTHELILPATTSIAFFHQKGFYWLSRTHVRPRPPVLRRTHPYDR